MKQIIKGPPSTTGKSFTVSCFFIRHIKNEHKVFLKSGKSRKLHGLHSRYFADIENKYFHIELDHESYVQSFRDFITALLNKNNEPYFNEGQVDYLVKAEAHRDSLRDSLLVPYVRQLIATYLECKGAYVEEYIYLGHICEDDENHHGFLISSVGVKKEEESELIYLLHTDARNRFDKEFKLKPERYCWMNIFSTFSYLYGSVNHYNMAFFTHAVGSYFEHMNPELLDSEKENILFYQEILKKL